MLRFLTLVGNLNPKCHTFINIQFFQTFLLHLNTLYLYRKKSVLTLFLTNIFKSLTRMPQLCVQTTVATSHHKTKTDDPAVLYTHCLWWSVNSIYHLQKCKTNAVFLFFFQKRNNSTQTQTYSRQIYLRSILTVNPSNESVPFSLLRLN